jgi:NADH-ubiquinone oxidoreductase chain 6
MLINIRVSELISDTNNNLPLALITIIAFFIPFNNLLPDAKTKFNIMGFEFNKFLQDLTNTKQISYVTSKN